MKSIQRITPFLWFNDNAEEAVRFYTSIFKDSKLGTIARYGEAAAKVSGRPRDSIMTIAFEIEGQSFTALNGGPEFNFTHAISFVVNCDTQEEIDYYWEKLSSGGAIEQCGWLKDKFGVSWQVVPAIMDEMMNNANEEQKERMWEAILQMKKFDIETLKKAVGTKETIVA